jgi:hypothetical protein
MKLLWTQFARRILSHEENNEKLGDSNNQMTTGVNCTGVFFLQFRKMWEKSKKNLKIGTHFKNVILIFVNIWDIFW